MSRVSSCETISNRLRSAANGRQETDSVAATNLPSAQVGPEYPARHAQRPFGSQLPFGAHSFAWQSSSCLARFQWLCVDATTVSLCSVALGVGEPVGLSSSSAGQFGGWPALGGATCPDGGAKLGRSRANSFCAPLGIRLDAISSRSSARRAIITRRPK